MKPNANTFVRPTLAAWPSAGPDDWGSALNRAHRRCSLSKDKDGIVTRETLTAHWTGGIDCRSVDFFDNDTMTLVEVTL